MDENNTTTGEPVSASTPQDPTTAAPQNALNREDTPDGENGRPPDLFTANQETALPLDSFAAIMTSEDGDDDDSLSGMSASGWAIPWSDLMMTMFVLFAVMLSYNMSERDLKDALLKSETTRVQHLSIPKIDGPVFNYLAPEQILEISRSTVKDANIENIDVIMDTNKAVHVNVRGEMLFDIGKAELREDTKGFLKKMSAILSKIKNEVHIVGHTDSFPIHSEAFPTNWELSTARASKIARFLIEQGSLDPARFTVIGNSMYRPSVPNSTPENKQKNRRVEIIITPDIFNGIPGGEK